METLISLTTDEKVSCLCPTDKKISISGGYQYLSLDTQPMSRYVCLYEFGELADK
jgi:hypothetical protein